MNDCTLRNVKQNEKLDIPLGGFVPLTSYDYPDHLSAVIFLRGCPWRCGYCHNPHLWKQSSDSHTQWSEIEKFLSKRMGFLDSVVISGGEPTQFNEIHSLVQNIKVMGFKVGLHTGGGYPKRLERIIPDLDWVGMDYKNPWEDYCLVTRSLSSGEEAQKSAQIIVQSKINHEFRTTIHPEFHDHKTIMKMAEELKQLNAQTWYLQEFRSKGCINEGLNETRCSIDDTVPKSTIDMIKSMIPNISIRYS